MGRVLKIAPGCSEGAFDGFERCLFPQYTDSYAQPFDTFAYAGITLVNELIDQYGLPVVHAYMAYIQENAANAVRDMLRDVAKAIPKDKVYEHGVRSASRNPSREIGARTSLPFRLQIILFLPPLECRTLVPAP